MGRCWNEFGNKPKRPEGVQDPQDGSVATATVTFTCILVQGGDPPRICSSDPGFRSSDPGFRCQIIPELVWPYSRTRLALFPNSFQHRPIGSQKTRFFLRKKQGFLKHGLIPELVWPYSRTPFPYSRTHLAAGRFRSTSSGIRPNEFGYRNKTKRVRE